jgi:hypothetical protein
MSKQGNILTQEQINYIYGAPANFSANGTAWVTYQGEQWAVGQRAEYCPPVLPEIPIPAVPLPGAAILMGSALIATVLIKRVKHKMRCV